MTPFTLDDLHRIRAALVLKEHCLEDEITLAAIDSADELVAYLEREIEETAALIGHVGAIIEQETT